MYEGFQMQQQYNEMLHLETLRVIRHVGHTVYMGIPTKKGFRKVKIERYYPLPKDRMSKEITPEEIGVFFKEKEAVISNGKIRGYMVNGQFQYIE